MTATTFVAIRHGRTAYNHQGLVQGQLDIPLDEKGMHQATMLRPRLAEYERCPVYTSDLIRATRTAQLALPDREPVLLSALRERDFASWQGNPYPSKEQRPSGRDIDFRPGGGESYREFLQRGIGAFRTLCQQHPGETVLVFSHGGLIRAVFSWALGLHINQMGRFHLDNVSLSLLKMDPHEGPFVVSLNDTSHLAWRNEQELAGQEEK